MSGFFLARRSRRAMLDAVQDLHDAVREVAQREVLLEEARQDFARAARIGGPGRLTGATVGDFELGVILGRGAMGEVYEARHVEAGTPAAVKVLLPSTGSQPGSLSRFFRELQVASDVRSPHVVRVLQVADADASMPFLAMELLRGSDLSSYLRARGRLDIGETVDLVRQVGRGLTDAADAGVVHRDLKPQNLFRVEADDGRAVWKILDFGVSKIAGHSGTLTQGNVVGTPVYMAPEQALGAAVDHRSDLYALAAIAYRCLTGQPPFKGGDVAAILYAVVNVMPAAPGRIADLPQLDRVFERALAKDPEQRFESADALAQALWRAGTRAHG
jgi:serine/threonine-protein kinase